MLKGKINRRKKCIFAQKLVNAADYYNKAVNIKNLIILF